jgi:hypothetical protein
MAFVKCKACDFITSFTVNYVVTDTDATFTVDDPCCYLSRHGCKMLRSFLGKAYCAFLLAEGLRPGATTSLLPTTGGGQCCTCDTTNFPNAEWEFGSGSVTFVGDFSAVPPANRTGVVEVAPPGVGTV